MRASDVAKTCNWCAAELRRPRHAPSRSGKLALPVGADVLSPSPHVAKIGAGRGMSFASFRRFWAVAANRNSSFAPLGPRRRNRSSLMRAHLGACLDNSGLWWRRLLELDFVCL